MVPEPVKTERARTLRALTKKLGISWRFILITVAALAILTAEAAYMPVWWSPVPLLSTLGLVAWRRHFLLAPLLGGLAGFTLWTVEMGLLPDGGLSRLLDAISSVEGLSPTLMRYIGPILFGLVTALAATTVRGAKGVVEMVLRSRQDTVDEE